MHLDRAGKRRVRLSRLPLLTVDDGARVAVSFAECRGARLNEDVGQACRHGHARRRWWRGQVWDIDWRRTAPTAAAW